MIEHLADGKVVLYGGDCLDVLATLPDNSVDSCACDPPYHLQSIVKRFCAASVADNTITSQRVRDRADGYARLVGTGFMGAKWDGGDIAFRPDVWRQVLRVLKPGGHLVAFGGTRTYHRMACAVEDAGFEIRDCIQWLYGSGFPKSHNAGNGWGTALKPACEPIVLARKPLSEGTVAANVLRWGTGALNIDGCRVEGTFKSGWSDSGSKASENVAMSGANHARDPKPDNSNGRWPANVVHDGSPEVVGMFPDAPGQQYATGPEYDRNANVYWKFAGVIAHKPRNDDSSSAARFFYTAKADDDDRLGSRHPTIKPVALMQWLVRLITPPNGVVLDPFAGTGTTGEACLREGFRGMILIEREAEYQDDIRRRMRLAMAGPGERGRETVKAKQHGKPIDLGPLFGGAQ